MTPREVDGVLVFDLRGEAHQLARDEWTPHVTRNAEDLKGVVVHQWAVKQVGTLPSMRARYGEPEALARRGLAVPYTISCGVTALGRVPVVAICHPVKRYTYASDAGNANYLSVGIMGRFAFEAKDTLPKHTVIDDAFPGDGALRRAVDVALQCAVDMLNNHDKASMPWTLLAHRQCANGKHDHFACPGEAAIEMAVASKTVRDGLLVPDPDLVILPKFGKAWPESWRRHLSAQQPVNPPQCIVADVETGTQAQHGE